MKHYILTRYNLGIYSKDNPYNHVVKNPTEWLEHRKRIFNEYCLPSVKAQTCQDFTWIIAFDPYTPSKVIEELDFPDNAVIVMMQPHLYLRTLEPESDWLITSRFDNDDSYRIDFVEVLQGFFRKQEEIIDIDYNVFLIENGHYYASLRTRANSPFLSLVEPWGKKIMTALGRPHTIMPDLYPAVKLGVYATQIIHDRNVINKVP